MVSRTTKLPNGTEITYDFSALDDLLRKMKGKYQRIIADGVNYGIYWELGHMSGENFLQHPFFAPALEEWRKPFQQALQQAVDKRVDNLDDVLDKLALDVATSIKKEISAIKDKGNGNQSDLIDTAALLNSITVLKPEDV